MSCPVRTTRTLNQLVTTADVHGRGRFLVAGVLKMDGVDQHRFVVVPEEKLAATKKTFARITSEHIYSLQRAVPKDLTAALFQVIHLLRPHSNPHGCSTITHARTLSIAVLCLSCQLLCDVLSVSFFLGLRPSRARRWICRR
jgi:hypothetical protein